MLVLGAAGSGKSTLLRTALEAEGSGVVLLAPGAVEYNSYRGLADNPSYRLADFDDPDFLPLIGNTAVEGLANAMRYLVRLRASLEAEPGRFAVLGIDTASGIGQLTANVMLKRCGLSEAPPARGTEGAQYYTGIANLLHQFFAVAFKCRTLGAHLIVLSHVQERENVPETAVAGLAGSVYLPMLPGGFKTTMPSLFDLTFYAEVALMGRLLDGHNDPSNPRHVLKWLPDPKRPTKSRLGALNDGKPIANEWSVLRPLIDAALATT